MRISLFIIVSIFICNIAIAQKSEETFTDSYTMKMSQARLMFTNGDVQGAMQIYFKFKSDPIRSKDPILNFRMGECYMALGEMQNAIKSFKEIPEENTNNDIIRNLHLFLGKAHYYIRDYYQSLDEYKKHKALLSETEIENSPINKLIKQSNIANNLSNNPVKVSIEIMGNNINTKYTESSPSVSANDGILIFSSNRPDSNDAEEHNNNIYISYRNNDGSWTDAAKIKGDINKNAYDANTSISPNGEVIYITRDKKTKFPDLDLYYSTIQNDGLWNSPIKFNENINTEFIETSASITPNGNKLYFVSDRFKRNHGQKDIFVSNFIANKWGFTLNLGKIINTEYDEIFVTMHSDGKTLFFASNCEESMGGYDIFMTKKINGRWTKPVNLGYPINTINDEFQFVLSANGRTAYLTSNRDGEKGEKDIYVVDMQNYFKQNIDIKKDNLAIVKGSVLNTQQQALSASITIKDLYTNKTVYNIKSDASGNFFITLETGKDYTFQIKAGGMEKFNDIISIPENESGKTQEFTRQFILNSK